MTEREWPQEQLDAMLKAVRDHPGSKSSYLAQFIPHGSGTGVSRGRALGLLGHLEARHLVTRTTAQRLVTWALAEADAPAG